VQCAKCYTGNEAGDDRCRSCGYEIPVDPAVREERELQRKAAEIKELQEKIAAKKQREQRDADLALARSLSDDDLDALRKQAADA
jgi:hypothetical protein